METFIENMELYAKENVVPIMQKEGMLFLQEMIQKYQIKTILEIGSAIGYSAIQMCRMDDAIKIVSIERDEIRYQQAVENIAFCKMEDRITLVLGDALETEINGKFDMIFIDAAKAQYIKFFERYEKNLTANGMIVSDNLKFHGLVDTEERIQNRRTRKLVEKIKRYISYLNENANYSTTFYDAGDGVAVSKRMSK